MARWGRCDYKKLEAFADRIGKMADTKQREELSQQCANDVAQVMLNKIIKRTTVKTGTLRRGWTASKPQRKSRDTYQVEVINTTQYASYYEYGHRGVYVPALGKTLHLNTHWTPGKFVMTKSAKEVNQQAPKIVEKRVKKYMESMVNGTNNN